MVQKLGWVSLLSYDNMWVVFGTHRRSKDVIFYKNKGSA